MGPNKINNDKPKKNKKRKVKLNLVFDEAKRKDFLGGFHKRKLQRKKQAQDEFEEKLKEERKRIRMEAKDSYKKMVVSRRNIPELEELLSNDYETEDVTVKVVELSTNDFAEKNNWIGQNKPQYEEDEKEESEDGESSGDEIPGMELTEKKRKRAAAQAKEEEEDEAEEGKKPTKVFKSKRDINKVIKKAATKKVQKSKTFQTKNKMEQLKNKKKSRQLKSQRRKFVSKKGKSRHRAIGKQPAA